MTTLYMNVARDGSTDLNLVRKSGVTGIRLVLTQEYDLTFYYQQAQMLGLSVLGVLARESFHDQPREPILADYADRYSKYLNLVQAGNEPDIDSSSSWTMTKQQYVELGVQTAKAFSSEASIVSGGLASGQPDWLDGMDLSWADAVGVHAYLKDAPNPGDIEDLTDITTLVEQYKQRTNLPIFISEWGWWGEQEPRAVEEVNDMAAWAAGTQDIVGFAYFCFSDVMVPPFGLYNSENKPKPRYKVFRDKALTAVGSPWPLNEPVNPKPVEPMYNPWQFFSAGQIAVACGTLQDYRQNIVFSWPKLVEQMVHAGINNRATQIGMAATIQIETGGRWLPIHEFREADGSIPAYWWGYDGGPDYHGRGYIQNTHRYNYRALGPAIAELWGTDPHQPDFDFVRFPDNLLNADMSAAAAAIYFRDRDISSMCRVKNWPAVRRAVQGNAAPEESINRLRVLANNLWAMNKPVEPEQPSEVEQLRLALRTLRDESIPRLKGSSLESALDNIAEIDRIVRQFVGDD